MFQSCYRFLLRMLAIVLGLGAYLFIEAAIIGSLNLFAALLLAAAFAYAAYRLFALSGMMRQKHVRGRGPRGRKARHSVAFCAQQPAAQRPGRAA